MNTMQRQVLEFCEKFGHTVGSPQDPKLSDTALRASLIEEESRETVDAIRRGDFVEAVAGLCDLLYVCFGAAIAFGIDLQPFFDEVHRTNMLKEGGPTRTDGKILKPVGWKPPEIRRMIRELGLCVAQ